jgi:hypothetical protein
MRIAFRLAAAWLLVAAPLAAQQQQGSTGARAAAVRAALEDLEPRFARHFELREGWFMGQSIAFYDFGAVPRVVGEVYWPIHGFDRDSVPVPVAGQRPIFSTLPALGEYSGLWRLRYVVVADNVVSNELRSVAAVRAMAQRGRAIMRDGKMILNLPLVPRGSTLSDANRRTGLGWFEGHDVAYFDFGPTALGPELAFAFHTGREDSGAPRVLRDQRQVVTAVPGSPGYSDLWDLQLVEVPTSYEVNSLRSVEAIRAAVDAGEAQSAPARSLRNSPVVLVNGAIAPRARSPLDLHAIPAFKR